jgi:hypothetical protein
VACRPLPRTVASASAAATMTAMQPRALAGQAVAEEADVAAGRGLVGPEAGADITFDLSMCFLCFFFTYQWLANHQLVDGFF